ncbi:hypothetical protein [Anoxynatronum sibiricum]|uniref:GNAT family N-acetyltransferase n=1 Tax=Anoxynatronum sibiricum TaxID=210623 RepID=A0ABU9VNZ1_9CLOT
MSLSVQIRDATSADQAFLRIMFYVAVHSMGFAIVSENREDYVMVKKLSMVDG